MSEILCLKEIKNMSREEKDLYLYNKSFSE